MPNNRQSRNLPCGFDLSGRYELNHGSYAQEITVFALTQ